MPNTPRLNKVVQLWVDGKMAFGSWGTNGSAEDALAIATSPYDFVLIEMEHSNFDLIGLRHYLQYLLNRRQLVEGATLQPAVAPFVRIPANARERNQWIIKQALDQGVYGIVAPHVHDPEDAAALVQACRYAPQGQRGDAPGGAARYWGLDVDEYYRRADLWPVNPEGELLLIALIEDPQGVERIREILAVPGMGGVLMGPADLSHAMGHPRNYQHPAVQEALDRVLAACKEANVPCIYPFATADQIEGMVQAGYRGIMTGAPRSFANVELGRRLAGRG